MGTDPSILSASNLANPVEEYQKALTAGVDRQAQGMKLSQLANETTTNQQNFQDQQAARQAMQQNTDATGNLNQPEAIKQIARQNPLMAKKMDQMLNQYGIDGAAQHAEMLQEFAAHAGPEDYAQRKQALIDQGIKEAANLPDYYSQNTMQKLLMSSGSAAQQTEMIKNQAAMQNQRAMEYIKLGKVPPEADQNLYNIYGSHKLEGNEKNPHLIPSNHLPPGAEGLKPGDTIPGGELDRKALQEYDKSIGSRAQNDPAYPQAGSNLLAVSNAMAVFNKYKDLNQINTNDQHILAMEGAKAMKGGASPTEDEVQALMPHNGKSMLAEGLSRVTGRPMPTNNAQHWEMMKDYFGKLRDDSVNTLKSAHDEAKQNAILQGANPNSVERRYRAGLQEIQSKAFGRGRNEKTAAFEPDVMNYAKTHNISPEQAQKIKEQRTGPRE